jgi:hypothetical protein
MITTVSTICGMQVGIEHFYQKVEDVTVGYLLIDIFIIRIQFAWYVE